MILSGLVIFDRGLKKKEEREKSYVEQIEDSWIIVG